METTLKLYQLADCPYCQIVARKLSYLGLSFVSIPVAKKRGDRKEIQELSKQNSVPVLQDGDKVLSDSETILQYLEEKYGQGTPLPANDLGLVTEMTGTIEEIEEKVVQALQKEKFGVLTKIDVKATLKKKLDLDVDEHVILGACNPQMAHQAMEMEPDISLLLPCNVTIRKKSEGTYLVSAVNPVKLLGMVGREDMVPLAGQVKKMLNQVIESLSS